MAYMNPDGLYRKYGTEKAVPTTGGVYPERGEYRDLEVTVNLTTLTATRLIVSDVTPVPAGMFIEQVDVVADTAATGGTSVSLGLIGYDRTTVVSDTYFVNALPIANMTPAGKKNILTNGVTSAGTNLGSTTATPGLVTATAAGTFTAGLVKFRIRYRGIGTITQ
jgi:hypothetical protein